MFTTQIQQDRCVHWEVAKAPSTLLLSLLSHVRENLSGEHCIMYCQTIITGFPRLCGEDARAVAHM